MRRIRPHVPRSRGIPRVDDGRVRSGIIFVIKGGLRWRDAPLAYGPFRTLCNRFVRSSRMGVFSRIFAALAGEAGAPDRLIIDSTQFKAHRSPASLRKRGHRIAASAAPQGGLNAKLAAVCAGHGRPVVMMLSAGQMNDQKGANILVPLLPPALVLIADRGDDGNPFRAARAERGITACIPPKQNRRQSLPARRFNANATASRLPAPASTSGAASPHATTAARPSSSAPSPSPPSSSPGSGDES
jgi:transposase